MFLVQTTRSLEGGSRGDDDLLELHSVFDINSDEDFSTLTEGKLPDADWKLALDKRGTVSVLCCSSSRAYSTSR